MCDHEEVLDSGEYVCVKCGIVLGQEYVHDKIYEQNSTYTIKIEKQLELYGSICNILDKLNINNFLILKKCMT